MKMILIAKFSQQTNKYVALVKMIITLMVTNAALKVNTGIKKPNNAKI